MKKHLLLVWRCLYPIMIHFGVSLALGMAYIFLGTFWVMLQQRGNISAVEVSEQITESYLNHSLYIMAIASIITIPVFYLFFRLDKKKLPPLPQAKNTVFDWSILVLVAASMCISLNSLITYSGLNEIFDNYDEVAEYLYSGGILLELLVVGILVPISEDILFRGLIFKRLTGVMKPVVAMVVSALIFGIYHANVVQGLYAFCLGMVIAACYWKFQNLWAPICMHIVANTVSVCITEIEVIGNLFEKRSVSIVLTITTTILWIGGTAILMKKNFKNNLEN